MSKEDDGDTFVGPLSTGHSILDEKIREGLFSMKLEKVKANSFFVLVYKEKNEYYFYFSNGMPVSSIKKFKVNDIIKYFPELKETKDSVFVKEFVLK